MRAVRRPPGSIAERDRARVSEALQDQTGRSQEHKGQCHLGDNEQIARTPRAARIGGAAIARFECELKVLYAKCAQPAKGQRADWSQGKRLGLNPSTIASS